PKGRAPATAEGGADRLVFEIERLHRRSEMLAHDRFEQRFPVVASEEPDQTGEIAVRAHQNPRLLCRQPHAAQANASAICSRSHSGGPSSSYIVREILV